MSFGFQNRMLNFSSFLFNYLILSLSLTHALTLSVSLSLSDAASFKKFKHGAEASAHTCTAGAQMNLASAKTAFTMTIPQ